ncbi:LGFP repeat-containing protein [Falsiroseomonas oryzae]|uniref:hypothetical protein n=1 Tax=Falsiroseomonas oryzae TaxID=2766473 RepID=UPI0022EB1141|nr:hypothetical protein [Roseomonas sp. MO-31]
MAIEPRGWGDTLPPDPGTKRPALLRKSAAKRHAFDARATEMQKAGFAPGALLREVPLIDAFPDRIAQRDYQTFTLFANEGAIRVIRNPIRDKWMALGGAEWGVPGTDDTPTGIGDGRQVRFDLLKPGAGGGLKRAILCSRVTNAEHLSATIPEKFVALGGVQGIGYLGTAPADMPARNADGSAAAPIPHHLAVDLGDNGHRLQLFFEVRNGPG